MPVLDTGDDADAATTTATTESTDQGDAPDGPRDDVSDRDTVDGSTDDVNELVGSGEGLSFEEAMSQMGAEPEDASADTEPDDSSSSETTDEADATGDTPDETDEPDGPDAGDTEEPSDEGAEADTEDEEETDAEDEDTPPALIDRVNEEFEDVSVEGEDDVVEELRREREGNDAIVTVAEAHPQVVDFLGDVLTQVQQNGSANLDTIAADHFDTDLPDPEEEPEAYREAVNERSQRQAQRQQERQELRQLKRDVEQLAETARSSVETVVEEQDMSEQEEKAFRRNLASFVNDPDEDFAEIYYRGANFESLVEQEREEAYKEGRNDAIRERREKKEGDGVAKLSSSETKSNEESDEPETEEAQDAEEVLEAIGSGSGNPLNTITE